MKNAALTRVCLWALVIMMGPSSRATTCSVSDANINFGVYNPLSSLPDDTNATIQTSCQAGTGVGVSYTISATTVLNEGERTLSSAGSSLQYNLYLDTARTVIWGDGTSGTSMIQDSFQGSATKTYSVYGRIFGGQYAATTGTYADTLTITVSY
jgi:spore coat protein U-like protein